MEPASIRYKNPGAMWGSAHAKKWGALNGGQGISLADGTGQKNTIAQFPTYVAGISAQVALWRTERYRNKKFRVAIVPWSGGNNVPSYIKLVASHVPGFSGDTIIDDAFLLGPHGIDFLKAQALHEAGRVYPASDVDWIEGRRLAFAGAKAVAVAKKSTGAIAAGGAAAAVAHQSGFGVTTIVLVGIAVAIAAFLIWKLKK